MTTDSNTSAAAERRAADLAVYQQLLDICKANPGIPLPHIMPVSRKAIWGLAHQGDEARRMAAIEAALPCPMTASMEEGDREYVLCGQVGAVTVRIVAQAEQVAERTVTGKREVDVTEWTRKPLEPAEDDVSGGQLAEEASRDAVIEAAEAGASA